MDDATYRIISQPATVFHGTRVSMAERIMADGFAPLPISQQIDEVAATFDLTLDALMTDLKAYNRFAIVDARPETVFVTGNRVKAGSWADRAPEATWEALWAVYRIRHPEVGWDWDSSQEGHLWVRAHRLDDPPAVLQAVSPLVALRRRHSDVTAADEFLSVLDSEDPDALPKQAERFRSTPEWLVRPGGLIPTGFDRVPTRVDDDLLRFMSGESMETLREQLRSDHWGQRGASAHAGDRPWHPFEQVWARLSRDRQAELGELVGVPVTSVLAAQAAESAEPVSEA